MSEARKRKVHTPDFKAKVGLEALRGATTINQIGQDYDVHPVQVGLWKKEIQAQANTRISCFGYSDSRGKRKHGMAHKQVLPRGGT